MSDNRNYSVITNFGCHWQCPYCIVRNTGIQIAETRMGATYDTVMDLADSGKMKFLSFSGGGDPLWGLDIRRAYWYASITRSLYEYDIETEMHTSMPSMVKRMYNLAPAVEFSRIVYHLRNVNMIRNLDSIDGEMIRVVFVVTPDFTKDKIDAIVHEGGREMNKRYKVCPLFWSDYGDERTLMNMGVFEKLLNEGWKILRVDTMPPTELSNNAVAATNVYILEREANDD